MVILGVGIIVLVVIIIALMIQNIALHKDILALEESRNRLFKIAAEAIQDNKDILETLTNIIDRTKEEIDDDAEC